MPNPVQLASESHMSAHKDFAKANEAYVATFGDKGDLPLPPSKKLLIGASRQPWNACTSNE